MNLELLDRSLRRTYDVLTAPDPEKALEFLREDERIGGRIALILCDYRMPGMSGAELLAESMRLAPDAKRVIITGYAEVDGIIASVNAGQIHYVVKKPWNQQELNRVIAHLVRVYQLEKENRRLLDQLRTANDRLREKELLLARNLDDRSRELLGANSELERINRDLEVLSYKDALTGLYSHRAFQERLHEELARAKRYRTSLSLVIADIDQFRSLNNDVGYQLGDEVLRQIAELLRGDASEGRLRDSDVVARFGGEEFIVLLPETNKSGAATKADRLREVIAASAFPADRNVTMSFGVAAFPDDAEEPDDLLVAAQRALRRAKVKGRDQVRVFGDEESTGGKFRETEDTRERLTIEREITSEIAQVPGQEDQQYPTYHQYMLTFTDCLELDRALNCLFVDLSELRRIELEYGINKHAEVFLEAGRVLDGLRGTKLRHDDLVCRSDDGEAYVCFLSAARVAGGDMPARDLEAVGQRVQASLEAALAPEVQDLVHDYPRITVGYARVLNNSMIRPERLVSRLVAEAEASAALMRQRTVQRDKALLQEIILNERLIPVYQPLVHLGTGDIFGFEALTRGPRKTPMESPMALFSVADEVGLTFELDRACFRNALRGAVGLEPVHRLFVNLLPMSFYDASFVEKEVGDLLDAAALTPANVVFEITERLAIENFASFRRALAGYTAMGFGVAIDDVGTRHSNLESVMALRPHFIKISDVLTRGVSRSTVKREMLRSLGKIAEAIDAVVVAEGIETPDDLAVLRDLKVHYGQGFFLARPGPPFPRLRASVRRMVQSLSALPREPIAVPPAEDPEFDPEIDDDGDFREDSKAGVMARGSVELPVPEPPEGPGNGGGGSTPAN
jgi:diguanylate cyclase (GGDEF)-like protein